METYRNLYRIQSGNTFYMGKKKTKYDADKAVMIVLSGIFAAAIISLALIIVALALIAKQ